MTKWYLNPEGKVVDFMEGGSSLDTGLFWKRTPPCSDPILPLWVNLHGQYGFGGQRNLTAHKSSPGNYLCWKDVAAYYQLGKYIRLSNSMCKSRLSSILWVITTYNSQNTPYPEKVL